MEAGTAHLDKSEINVQAVTDKIIGLMHPNAQEVILDNINQVATWVEARIAALGIDLGGNDDYAVDLKLKPYNDNGLGIQSVEVEFSVNGRKLRTEDRRGRKEFQAPTIGVVADGMIAGEQDNVQWAVAEFPVDEGREERIQILSDGFYFDSSEDDEATDGLPKKQNVDGTDNVIVRGPSQARTLIQRRKPSAAAVREATNRGVYACIYREARDVEKPLAPEDAIYVKMAA